MLLDGGMGQELIRRRGGPASALWSAEVMRDHPGLVRAVHADFIAAGAPVLTLNTYMLTRPRLARLGVEDQFEALLARACALAVEARDAAADPASVRIAGALPPLAASYKPELVPAYPVCLSAFRELVAAQQAVADLFIAETMTTIAEAVAATEAVVAAGKPCWTALTVDDQDGTRLRSGEPLMAAAVAVVAVGAEAVMVNCSAPEAVTQAMPVLARLGVPFGGYANGFTSIAALEPGGSVESLSARTDLGPAAYVGHVRRWLAAGASLVGGCCEVGPDHIRAIAEDLRATGRAIVSDVNTALTVSR